MAETAEDILILLEQRQLVSERMLATLRKKVESASSPVSARKLAKVLLDKGLVTPTQAKQLLKADVPRQDKPPAVPPPVKDSQARPDKPKKREHRKPEDAVPDLTDAEEMTEQVAESPSEILEAAVNDPIVDDRVQMDLDAPGVGGNGLESLEEDTLQPNLGSPSSKPSKSFKRSTQRWDSKLILGGSATLILLVVSGFFLYFLLSRGTAEEQFKLAMEAYNNGSYMQAIADFQKYLNKFPKDTRVSEARVRIGLAKMWQEADVSRNWQNALDVSLEVLPKIEVEESFGATARPELAGLLTTVADGFAELAGSSSGKDAEGLVEVYKRTIELINNSNYVPSTQRKSVQNRLDDVEAKILTVQRSINRDQELTSTVDGIRQATSSGDVAAAYQLRDELLKIYPALEDHIELQKAIREITDQQLKQVQVSDEVLTPLLEDEPTPRQMALPSHSGESAQGVDGHVLYYLAGGAVYGIDASTGQALWYRFVGHESEIHPTALSTQPGSDVLYVDARSHELVRRSAQDGQLVWRLPVRQPLLGTISVGERLVVTTKSGEVLLVEQKDGGSSRQVRLPQSINVRPGIDEKRSRIYVAADHSNLYALDADTLACEEVYYIGHRTGAVSCPPVSALGFVMVAERLSPEYSQLHVLATDNNGLALQRAQDPIRLDGQVVTPPIVMGRQLLVVTNLGAVYLFEIDKRSEHAPVSELTKTVKTAKDPVDPQMLVAEGQLWVGDNRLTSYRLQTARGSIVRGQVTHNGDSFVGPMRAIGKVLFHMRRRANQTGMTVTANNIDRQSTNNVLTNSIWSIDLGVPSAGEPLSQNGSSVMIVSAQADLFEIQPGHLGAEIATKKVETKKAPVPARLHQLTSLSDGRTIFVDSQNLQHVVLVNPTQRGQEMHHVELAVPSESLATPPVPLGSEILALTHHGQIYALDLATGQPTADPFQPNLRPGQLIHWQRPAILDQHDHSRIIVYDGNDHLYRLVIEEGARRRLTAEASQTIDMHLHHGLAAVEDTVFGILPALEADKVVAFGTTDLVAGEQWEVKGHVVWGPARVGNYVMVATDAQQMYCFTAGQQLQWKAAMPYGPLVGTPLVEEGSIIFSGIHGTVWRVAANSGKELGHVIVGKPLGTGPVPWNRETLLLSGYDGTIHAIEVP